MKPSILYLSSLLAAVRAAPGTCGCNPSGKCFRAISEIPAVGQAFCASWLSVEPVTTVITKTATATSAQTNVHTTTTVLTLTTSTVTTSVTRVSSAAVLPVRAREEEGSENILAKCSNRAARISNACGCFLSDAPAPTVTVTETVTSTEVAEDATTTVETVTSGVIATATATVDPPQPTPSGPAANLFTNGDFASFTASSSISPWIVSFSPATGGAVAGYWQAVNLKSIGLNLCSSGHCMSPPAQGMPRLYPARQGDATVDVSQNILGDANTRYSLSFRYLCFGLISAEAPGTVTVFYKGAAISAALPCVQNSNFNFYRVAPGVVTFDTDATGAGELLFRFANPATISGTPYFYLADVSTS